MTLNFLTVLLSTMHTYYFYTNETNKNHEKTRFMSFKPVFHLYAASPSPHLLSDLPARKPVSSHRRKESASCKWLETPSILSHREKQSSSLMDESQTLRQALRGVFVEEVGLPGGHVNSTTLGSFL